MKWTARISLMLAMIVALAGVASANTWTPRVDRREVRQERRIREGERSGRLTPREARRLQRGQARVHRMERRAKSDGRVTLRERRHLGRAQNRQSRRIYRFKHNGRQM